MTKPQTYSFVFLFGGALYSLIEILGRGYTHWSMTVLGGLCLALMYRKYNANPNQSIFRKCLYGALLITSLEFITGCIVNLWLDWNVWDYSHVRMNFLGQICLPFILLWYCLSFVGAGLCGFFKKKL